MDEQKLHFRHIMLYEFRRGSTAASTARNICAVYGEDAVVESTCQNWFTKFRSGDTTLTDAPRSGRHVGFDEEALQALLKINPRQTTRELATQLNCSQSTIDRHLHALGKVEKFGTWVPHELSPGNKIQRMSTCASLLSRQHNEPFLERIVTGDEKCVLYVNMRRKRQWLDPGENIYA